MIKKMIQSTRWFTPIIFTVAVVPVSAENVQENGTNLVREMEDNNSANSDKGGFSPYRPNRPIDREKWIYNTLYDEVDTLRNENNEVKWTPEEKQKNIEAMGIMVGDLDREISQYREEREGKRKPPEKPSEWRDMAEYYVDRPEGYKILRENMLKTGTSTYVKINASCGLRSELITPEDGKSEVYSMLRRLVHFEVKHCGSKGLTYDQHDRLRNLEPASGSLNLKMLYQQTKRGWLTKGIYIFI
ncbi:hypothetical protein [Pasteuria penetrans]|uniref:hypothetical protein n=1 Tax=Pasteuria penetrans TaxID=86005 RepID=UPI000FA788ED|nr:hypothetical protein [Pasteuria penetrans]